VLIAFGANIVEHPMELEALFYSIDPNSLVDKRVELQREPLIYNRSMLC
jgi:hypothetical protein